MERLRFKNQWLCGGICAVLINIHCPAVTAETLQYPRTAADIEQALSPPPARTRGLGGIRSQRGMGGIAPDPAPSMGDASDPYDYLSLRDAPKVGADVRFDFNSDRIRPEYYPLLNEFVKALQGGLTGVELVIAGHTDSQGSASYNSNLSRRRAQSIVNYLVRQGVAPNQLIAKGFGEDHPIADNNTAAGRSQNRRVEVIRAN